jgi:hypothetical protein
MWLISLQIQIVDGIIKWTLNRKTVMHSQFVETELRNVRKIWFLCSAHWLQTGLICRRHNLTFLLNLLHLFKLFLVEISLFHQLTDSLEGLRAKLIYFYNLILISMRLKTTPIGRLLFMMESTFNLRLDLMESSSLVRVFSSRISNFIWRMKSKLNYPMRWLRSTPNNVAINWITWFIRGFLSYIAKYLSCSISFSSKDWVRV